MNGKLLSRWPFVAVLLIVLLVGAGLRFAHLPNLPLGLHYDEAANGILAGEIAHGGERPVFIPSYTGKEVLFFYWAALWMKLLGATELALRLSAALVGLATVAATVWSIYELAHNRRDAPWVALLTAAFLATSFWHLVLSRYGFRAVTQPLLQALTVAALWRGLRREEALWLLLAGFFCGLTAYTYLAARAFPVPLAVALLSLVIADRERRRKRLVQVSIFVAVAAVTLAPLAYYWLTHAGSFLTRANQVAAASWREAWRGFRACVGMLFLRGDPYIRFNLPHRPLFDPITAVLFLVGFIVVAWGIICLVRRSSSSTALRLDATVLLRSATRIFLLTHLVTMLLPSALATGEITPSNLRVVGLLPFVYLFPALGLSALVGKVWNLLPEMRLSSRYLLPATCLLLIVITTPLTATAYFRDWATSPALYYAADGDMASVAAYLNHTDLGETTPYVASLHYRHPTLAFLAEDYDAVRWLTEGRTLIFPAEGKALLIFPRAASDELDWVRSMVPEDTFVTGWVGPDYRLAFHVYRVGSEDVPAPAHSLRANFGHVVQVLGYEVVGEARSGGNVDLTVWWKVLNEPDRGDYRPVARLADAWGSLWGEKHPFHYPSEQWVPGEVIVDRFSVPVAPGAPPGAYAVRLGFYSLGADARLPLLDDASAYAGTYVELPVHLAQAESPPPVEELDIRERLGIRADGLHLLGANLDTTQARPGERLYLTLFWQAEETGHDRDVTLSLGEATLYEGAPVHGTYPTSRWSAGEIVADRYDPRLPLDTPPGDYVLRLALDGTSVDLGRVTVQATDRAFEVPPIAHPLTATLGGQVELLGYDLSSETLTPGDTLTLTLYWRALAEMERDYTVFTHLVAPDGSMSGQKDSQPVGGTYPTSLWLPDEVVADVYEIPVRANATPGEHRLEVGMYVAETGARLAVEDHPGDAILLQSVGVGAVP